MLAAWTCLLPLGIVPSSHTAAAAGADVRRVGLPMLAADISSIESMDDFMSMMQKDEDGKVKVVKFVAKNCRGCIAMKPKFDNLAKKHADKASFYEANFAQARLIFGMEKVRRTPTVLYYYGNVGRVAGFPFGPTPASGGVLADEFDYVCRARAGLDTLSPSAVRPALRYKALTGMLRALVTARERLEAEAETRGATLVSAQSAGALAKVRQEAAAAAAEARAAVQKELVAEAAALFAWVDRDSKGAIDAADLADVAKALAGNSPFGVTSGRVGATGGSGLPTEPEELDSKLQEALKLLGDGTGAIRLAAFTDLMLLHADHEKAKLKPEAEARAAFALLDANGTGGMVPTADAAQTIAAMCEIFPCEAGVVPAEACEAAAIERMFATFDYEDLGHLHFDCFARVVVRSTPSAW